MKGLLSQASIGAEPRQAWLNQLSLIGLAGFHSFHDRLRHEKWAIDIHARLPFLSYFRPMPTHEHELSPTAMDYGTLTS